MGKHVGVKNDSVLCAKETNWETTVLMYNRSAESIMKYRRKVKMMPSGFTLVELMTVIAILAILAAVAFPLLFSALPNYRLRAAARELMIDFKKAKVEAIKRNKNVLIQFTPVVGAGPGGSYELCVDSDNDGACGAGEVIANIAMPRDVRLTQTSFTSNKAGYNPRGLPWNNLIGNVTMSTVDGKRTYQISLSMAGAVSM
jgi:type IV fimbrial biogenesis protein FimT